MNLVQQRLRAAGAEDTYCALALKLRSLRIQLLITSPVCVEP